MSKRITVGFPLTDDWFEKSEIVEKAVGRTPAVSAGGRRRREMEFDIEAGEDAREVILKVIKQCPFVDSIMIGDAK